jgi:hypothetical protein
MVHMVQHLPSKREALSSKDNDGGGECNYDIYTVRTFVNVTMYPQYNNKAIIKTKYKKC